MEGLNASRVLALGLIIAVTGGGFFGYYHFNETDPWTLMAAYGLMGLGGVMFAAGFLMMILALREPAGVHAQDATTTFTALARCMVAMSIADGSLDQKEVRSICKIFETLTGDALDEDYVEDIAVSMHNDKSNIETELSRVKHILTKDLKEKIIKASFYILAADGVIEKAEEETLDKIRKGLDYPIVNYKMLKQQFLKKFEGKLERGTGG